MEVPSSVPRATQRVQLAILGDGLVGKTAILRHLKGLPFDTEYRMTVGADFVVKRMTYKDVDLSIQIFDVGGQPQFAPLRSRYYGQAQGVIIVFDLMRRETFEHIPTWLDEVLQINKYKFLPLMLVGNKEDLGSDTEYQVVQHQIDEYVEILRNWGQQYDPNFFVVYNETSAKTGYNVENCFLGLIDQLLF
ncbi:MAG: Rab family GTPase [Candidatus Kariarchaeaceae archaeon]